MKALLTALALIFGLLCASVSAKEKKDDAPDPKKFEEYKAGAGKGNAQAQLNLGHCYGFGRGVKPDFAESVKWYRKAAEQGYAEAQFNLGVCYYNGSGVKKDYVEAYALFTISDPTSSWGVRRDDLEKTLTPDVISAGLKRSKELREQIDAR